MHAHTSRSRRGGFSLLELVVVLALLTILTGVIAPSASALLGSRARRATLQELTDLGGAAVEHFEDTAVLPADVTELSTSSTPGWSGPYLVGVPDDTISGGSGYRVDAWSRPYRLQASGDVLELRSSGKDAAYDTSDDLVLEVDVTPVRRRWTLERLAAVNTAIEAWNRLHLPDEPLPADYTSIHATLVANGFLPPTAAYEVDGWGDPFVPDPAGRTPVTRVRSVHVGLEGGS